MDNDSLCLILGVDLCDYGFKGGCKNCPLRPLTSTTFNGPDYLKELQSRISDALSLLNS